jgi:hypothetical protein
MQFQVSTPQYDVKDKEAAHLKWQGGTVGLTSCMRGRPFFSFSDKARIL